MTDKTAPQLALGINTGFAVNRYAEHDEWIRIVGDELGLKRAQITADMLNVDLPAQIINKQVKAINAACARHDVHITSSVTGAVTRVNHLAHPDMEIRAHWIRGSRDLSIFHVNLAVSQWGAISVFSPTGITAVPGFGLKDGPRILRLGMKLPIMPKKRACTI